MAIYQRTNGKDLTKDEQSDLAIDLVNRVPMCDDHGILLISGNQMIVQEPTDKTAYQLRTEVFREYGIEKIK